MTRRRSHAVEKAALENQKKVRAKEEEPTRMVKVENYKQTAGKEEEHARTVDEITKPVYLTLKSTLSSMRNMVIGMKAGKIMVSVDFLDKYLMLVDNLLTLKLSYLFS